MRPRYGCTGALLVMCVAAAARGSGPADYLLRLVPPDAGATLAIEDLRGHAHDFCASPLADGLKQLPAVQDWLKSDRYRRFERARTEIEKTLDVPLTTIRDRLLGEAVVLSLHISPNDGPEQAQGLLLLRCRDRAWLDRLIARLNDAEKQGGPLVDVSQRTHRNATYWVRTFRPGTKPHEYYAIVGADSFAWSNSESVMEGVLDRKAGLAPGLGDDANFRKVRDLLPDRAVASLFVNPRFLERLMAADPRQKTTAEEQVSALIARNLAAVDYAGAALEWRDGFVLHTHEAIDPSKLDEPLRRWGDRQGADPSPLLSRVPATALALAAGHFDFGAIHDSLMSLVPEADRLRVENGVALLRGLLMGKDLRTEILPCLGPSVLVFADSPRAGGDQPGHPAVVVAVNLCGEAGDRGVPAALDNALRSFLAFYALDPARKELHLRVESRESSGVRLTSLSGGRPFFTYAIENGLLVFGTSADAVAEYCASGSHSGAGAQFERFRATYFPTVETFAYLDLQKLFELADARRTPLAEQLATRHGRSVAAARHDLDQALALMNLFEGAFATSTIDRGFTAVHRTLGLIARNPTSGGTTLSRP